MALGNNVVAFWDLDADVLDDSGLGHHGTNNGVTFAGGVGNFNGSSDISVPGNLLTANQYTLSLWFNPTSLPSYQAIVAWYTANGDSLEFFTTQEQSNGGWLPAYAGPRFPVNTFVPGALTHVVASCNGSGLVTVYVNNVQVIAPTASFFSTFMPAGRIGSRGGAFNLTGTMQSVGLFSDTKDSTWVNTVYNGGVPLTWAGMAPKGPLDLETGAWLLLQGGDPALCEAT